MSHIAVLGDALVDIVDGKEVPGGAALNVAVGLARLGSRVDLVAMVADDRPGALLRQHCASNGVNLVATHAPLGTATATATRIGDTMRYDFNEAGKSRFIDTASALDTLNAADLVVVSCLAFEDPAQAGPLLDIDNPELRLVLDPNPRPGYLPDAESVLRFGVAVELAAKRSRLVKIGDEDASLIWGRDVHDIAARLADGGLQTVLVTEGPGGATVYTPTGRIHAPIVDMDAPIIDTIGAGDATLAAVAAALADGEIDDALWADVLDDAMRIAAATCRVAGGLLQFPQR